MNELIFQNTPTVTLATNTFINVPVILKFEDTNLIEIVKEEKLGYTTSIPIHHSDGTYLAKVKGTRMFLTEDGKKAGVNLDKFQGLTVCKMGNQTLFEIHHKAGDSFKTSAELYTPEGYFVKCSDLPTPGLIDTNGNSLKVGGLVMSGTLIKNYKTGIWLRKNGSLAIGVN